MKRAFLIVFLIVMSVFVLLFGAIAAMAAQTAAPVATASPSLLAWFSANQVYIYGLLLAISELLGVTPWFKGNGVLDTIIKGIKLLSSKETPSG